MSSPTPISGRARLDLLAAEQERLAGLLERQVELLGRLVEAVDRLERRTRPAAAAGQVRGHLHLVGDEEAPGGDPGVGRLVAGGGSA